MQASIVLACIIWIIWGITVFTVFHWKDPLLVNVLMYEGYFFKVRSVAKLELQWESDEALRRCVAQCVICPSIATQRTCQFWARSEPINMPKTIVSRQMWSACCNSIPLLTLRWAQCIWQIFAVVLLVYFFIDHTETAIRLSTFLKSIVESISEVLTTWI